MIQIPNSSKQFIQTNDSDVAGNIYATKNCDFDSNKGKIQLGKRLLLNTGTADVAEITSYPVGFRFFNNGSDSSFYTIAGASNVGYVFKSLAIDANFSKVTTSGAPADIDYLYSDIETAFGELYVTSAVSQKAYYLNASNAWASVNSVGGTGMPMMLCRYGGRMYCSKNGTQIQSWDSSHTLVSPSATTSNTTEYAVNLPDLSQNITWMRPATRGIFIGTLSRSGDKGYVYFWDGRSTQITSSYRMKSGGALAAVIDNDVPLIMDTNGALLDWNGGTFSVKDSIFRKSNKPLFNPYSASNQRFIHPNGMSIINGKPHMLLDLTNYDVTGHGGTQEDCNPSGIWVYDEETKSLKHKHSFGLTKSSDTITDYGQFRIRGAGALSEILTAQSPITTNGTFLAGATLYPDATTISSISTGGIFYEDSNDTLKKAGYFITPKVYAGADKLSITDAWGKAYLFHDKFLNASDKSIVKYRTVEDTPTEGTITWTSTTTFTSTLDLSSYAVGDEVEPLQGLGSGLCSHITNISYSAPTYTVTVDETYTGATGTSRARFSKWIKAGTIQDLNDFDEVPVTSVSSWIQFKVFAIWTGKNQISKLAITNQVSQKME